MSERLSKNILATLAYFDVFDYPLTAYEVYRYMIESERLLGGSGLEQEAMEWRKTLDALDDLRRSQRVSFHQGYYYLPGRESLVRQRRARSKSSELKLKQMKRLFWIFRFVPFVRMVGVTGTLSMKNIDQESDWDVFIALQHGRIWTGRVIVTSILHALGKRRHGTLEKDRVCLNYYVTDRSLEIAMKDLFAAREYAFMTPLVGEETYASFERKNRWIKNFMPHWDRAPVPSLLLWRQTRFSRMVRYALESLCSWTQLEAFLKKKQQIKINSNPKTHIPGGYIQADDEGLIFLPKPQGPKTFEEFKERLNQV